MHNENLEQRFDVSRSPFVGATTLLRPIEVVDYDRLCQWWNDPSLHYLQHSRSFLRPRNDLKSQFMQWGDNSQPHQCGYGVALHSGELIGLVLAQGLHLPEKIATMAIMIGPEFQGNRYGVDALSVFTAYLFNEMGAHKIEVHVAAYNTRALKVYTSLGFEQEGQRRDGLFHNGCHYDQILLGLLRTRRK